MRRVTEEGFVVLSPHGSVRGVGLDPIGAWRDATWRRNEDARDLMKEGFRCVAARVTVTFDPKVFPSRSEEHD